MFLFNFYYFTNRLISKYVYPQFFHSKRDLICHDYIMKCLLLEKFMNSLYEYLKLHK